MLPITNNNSIKLKSFRCELFNLKNKEECFYNEEAQNISVFDGLNDGLNQMRAWLPFNPLNRVSISNDDFSSKRAGGKLL